MIQSQKEFPPWFPNKKVSEYLPVIQTNTRYMLTDRDKNGKRIYVYKSGNNIVFKRDFVNVIEKSNHASIQKISIHPN